MERIHIYHSNDVHSHLEHWPRIQDFLQQKRAQYEAAEEDFFLFDIGDFIDRWHPLTDATMGKANVNLLNESCYTAITIGNNEGINLPHESLNHLYKEAQFDVLLANLYQQDGQLPDWAKPYTIYHTKKGTKIGVIGLTAPFVQLYELLGWICTDPFSEMEKWIHQLKTEVDIVILLSHLGIQDDERMVQMFPDIDVIIGAHTHHVFPDGKLINGTLLGAAGKFGYYLGQITLEVNQDKTIASKVATLYEYNSLPPLADEVEKVQLFINTGKELLQEQVITLKHPLESHPFQETELSMLLCQAVREWCKADCAMVNAGLLLGPLLGKVTLYDLLTICPHPINPCVVEVTGAELLKLIQESKNETLHHKQIKGLGFRGDVLGIFVYDGIQFQTDGIYIANEELVLSKMYTLALPDMFTFGHFFKDVLPIKEKKYLLPEFLRDILRWKLEN
ncbi:bifunctional metallophosphatase/5'-nucleotidase [Bacillus rubiinfantis]|uniref:bifunctional metallophosphatase/5'-nucleotidase n=1 Tax=Bacillus rubiinfantis TaxID=1499680 RepID=UPI0005A6F443|nr:bifunctional UDP-sugar hydrolase/5'-nucleotidase [Bacillus rubiinfantis]